MCSCIRLLSESLAQNPRTANTALDIGLQITRYTADLGQQTVQPVMKIATYKRDSKRRQKAVSLFCTYCPVCGEKIGEAQP